MGNEDQGIEAWRNVGMNAHDGEDIDLEDYWEYSQPVIDLRNFERKVTELLTIESLANVENPDFITLYTNLVENDTDMPEGSW